jgi:endoglucanase
MKKFLTFIVFILLCFVPLTANAATPAKVTNVKITASSTTSLKISWSKVSGATGYQIYRATSKTDTYTKIGSTTSLNYTDTSLSINKTYYYKVRAYTKTQKGSFSEIISKKTPTSVFLHGKLSVKGSDLVDKKGKKVQLTGISTHGLSWFPQYVNRSAFQTMRDNWKVDVVRLAMYTAEYNGYCTGDTINKKNLEKLIDNGVQYATELGIYVIIDWHILSDSNPNQYKTQSKAFFKKMAKKYSSYNNVIFEICNEPNSGTTWSDIKSYAKTIIKTIRSYSKDAIILVGTPTWSQEVDKAAASPITGYKNLMYTMHYYAATHQQDFRDRLVSAYKKGLPIFISEFGICDASGNGEINKTQANKWISVLNKYNISYVAWNLSNKQETSALIKSSCSKTSKWKTSDLSDSGKWIVNTYKKNEK